MSGIIRGPVKEDRPAHLGRLRLDVSTEIGTQLPVNGCHGRRFAAHWEIIVDEFHMDSLGGMIIGCHRHASPPNWASLTIFETKVG
jgi:hypothetical protein